MRRVGGSFFGPLPMNHKGRYDTILGREGDSEEALFVLSPTVFPIALQGGEIHGKY